jgi:pimeloyl-ACP methyl ester carboxylesterase
MPIRTAWHPTRLVQIARPRLTRRTLSIAAVASGAVAGAALQGRHLRGLARDPELARLRAPRQGRSLTVRSADGTALHAEAFGPADGHTVVLAHGWTEQLAFWGPVIGHLTTAGHRVVAYDLRGHGASEAAVDGDYALERFGEDVEAVLAAAVDGAGRATVAGHSLGAMSIAAWADAHDVQARADGAALINIGLGDLLAGHLLLGQLAQWANHPRLSRAVIGLRAPIPPFSTPVSQALIRYAAFGPEATRGQVAFYERMLVATPTDARAAVGLALSDMDLWDAVTELTVPTLVIAGANDRLTPPAQARRIAAALPQPVGLLELSATGHMSPLERPAEVADALGDLIETVTATAGAGTGSAAG